MLIRMNAGDGIERFVGEEVSPADRLRRELAYVFPGGFSEGILNCDAMRQALGDPPASKERYSFTWAGKRDAIRMLRAPGRGALAPDRDESLAFDAADNIFIEADNLEALQILYRSYAGRVKLVYIDPPYNTEKDRIYRDNFAEPVLAYLKATEQATAEGDLLTSNPETSGRKHSAWLSMMYPRLFLARQLLSDEGVICVSIDDNEVFDLRMLMNEVFGEENFAGQISVINNPKGRGLREHFAVSHDYVLIYTRGSIEEHIGVEKTPGQIEREYPIVDGKRRYRLLELRNTHRQFNRKTRRFLWFPIYVAPKTGGVSLTKSESSVEVWPRWDDGLEGCWTWQQAKVDRDKAQLVGRQVDGNWKIFRKAYSDDDEGNVVRKKLQTVWTERQFHTEVGQAELDELIPGRVFEAPKPVGLLKQIIEACTRPDEGDIVLDFFAGSGTTGHATVALNAQDGGDRRFILVQFPERTPGDSNAREAGFETISQICRERLRRAIAKIGAQPDSLLSNGRERGELGFRAFRLTESNILQWRAEGVTDGDDYAAKMELFVDPLAPGWQPLNVIFEVIEREGYSLTARVLKADVPDVGSVYTVVDEELGQSMYVTLEDRLSLEIVKALNLSKDDHVICRDVALDDTVSANIALQCRLKVI